MKKRRLKLKLLPKFVVSLTILGVVLTVVISLFSYVNTRQYLENMYAQRAVFGAQRPHGGVGGPGHGRQGRTLVQLQQSTQFVQKFHPSS